MSLAGRNVAIWGDAAPHALARPLAAAGARVLLLSSGATRPEDASAYESFRADGGSVEDMERLAATVCSEARRISALVIQPAIAIAQAAPPEIDPCAVPGAVWARALESGLKLPFFLARAFATRMAAAGGGRIVLIAASPPETADLVSAVVRDGMVTLALGLAKAMPQSVGVHAVVGGENEDDATNAVAESASFLIGAASLPSGTILRLDRPRA